MKGITLCAECAYYSMKKHKCTRGATDEGKPTARFYADCPLDDVVPVKHGRWEDRGGLLTPMHRYDEFTNPDSVFYGTCSVCGRTVYQGGILNGFKYCPHCGAKMDLKEGAENA